MANLLHNYMPIEPVLTESVSNPGNFFLEGVFQRAGAKNQNGRVYSKPILERECDKYLEEKVREGVAYGELDHPNSTVVSLKNASHKVTDLWWDGDDLLGKVLILHTPNGNIVKRLSDQKCKVGISSRGTGNVVSTNEGVLDVQDDFELICFDFVADPSTFGAYMKESASLNESVGKDPYWQLRLRVSEVLNL